MISNFYNNKKYELKKSTINNFNYIKLILVCVCNTAYIKKLKSNSTYLPCPF